jgi:DNA polymerase-3 subunit gamma/tau
VAQAVPVPVAPTAAAPVATPVTAPVATPAEAYTTVEVPLIQRVFAAQEAVAPEGGVEPGYSTAPAEPFAPAASFEVVTPAAPVEDTPWPAPVRPAAPAPAAGDLWRAPSRPEHVPAPPPPATPGTSWVVREIQLDGEPGAALTMRILDLTTPAESPSEASPGTSAELPADEESVGGWSRFARPA